MLSLFDALAQELSPLKERLDCLHTKKKWRRVMPAPLHEGSLPYQCFHRELLFIYQENKKATPFMPNMGEIIAAAILKE